MTDKATGDELPQDRAPNAPPVELFSMEADDLYMEAENWCDGEPICTEQQAADLTTLIGRLEKLGKDAEATRAAEKKPHLDAGRLVDSAWKPITEKVAKAVRVAKRAMTPWLEALEAERNRLAQEARREADAAALRLREQAEEARRSSNIVDEDVQEALEHEAKMAARAARDAEKAPAVSRGEGKALSLRDVWLVNITDRRELLKYYLMNRPDFTKKLEDFLYSEARADVRSGQRNIPGCSIWSEKKAV